MTLKNYLSVMSVLTVISWGLFFFVAKNIDPQVTNWLGFFLFYLSLFISLIGTSAIIGFIIRFIALKKELAFNSVKIAFRQSFLLSLFIIILLFLKGKDLNSILNLSLLVIIFAILELFLINYKRSH